MTTIELTNALSSLRTLIVSVEGDMSLGCLSTTPNQTIQDRLTLINIMLEDIKLSYNYDASFMVTQSAYTTIAQRKYAGQF